MKDVECKACEAGLPLVWGVQDERTSIFAVWMPFAARVSMPTKIGRRPLRMIVEMRMAVADDLQVGPGLQLVEVQDLMAEMVRRHLDLVYTNAGLVVDRDYLRQVIEGLLGVLGKYVDADEIARWRSIAGIKP